ncbi:hypothetical protein ACEPAG_2850 [Sanghuangporus baumii]
MRLDCANQSESWLSRFVEMNAGFLLVIPAQVFFDFMDLTVKLLNEIDPPVPTLVVRTAAFFSTAYMIWKKMPEPFLKGVRNLLDIRGFCGFVGLFGTDTTERLIVVGVALVGVLGASGAYKSIRAIGNCAHAMHAMSYFSLWCVVVSTIGMIVTRESIVVPTRLIWLVLIILIGIFGFVAQMLLTLGFQRGAAGHSAMAINVQMIFAIILERIFFHTVPSISSVTGIAIIMCSAIFVALTRQAKETNMAVIGGTDAESNQSIEYEAQGSDTCHLVSATEEDTCYESISDTRVR